MRKVTLRTESLAERLNRTIMASNDDWGKLYSHNLSNHNKMQRATQFWKNMGITVAIILALFATYKVTRKICQRIGQKKK